MTKAIDPSKIQWLDLKTCEAIYERFRAEYQENGDEPLPEFSRRYPGKLESILESVKLRYGQMEQGSIEQIAASYFVRVTKSQALVNGNKRMGVLFTTVFLYLNGYELQLSQQRLAALSLLVATSTDKVPTVIELIIPTFEKKLHERDDRFNFSIRTLVSDYIQKIPTVKLPSWQRK